MPDSCMECKLFNVHGCRATMQMFDTMANVAVRQSNCPLVGMPETHGSLADIEDVKKAIFDYHGEDEQKVRTMINAILSSVPIVIESEGK